ncbi:MAG: 4-vinyl reductase, partial [Candidatus Micrarchaeota archaeon]|nr:4-vinyl reductase [Candidatus Micrarchaeota archaeon]
SKHTDRDLPNIGKNIHLYEAGIIAGYLSSSTGVRISARESRCVYKNADSCQFIATPFTDQRLEPKISISSITNSISGEIIKNQFRHLDNEYYRILAYLPLLKQPIFEEVRKLLVLSGERIAQRTVKSDTQRIISSIANYFGVRQVSMAQARRGKRIIRLTFDSYNSVYPYTLIPTALISGLISSAYKTTTEVNVLTNKDNTYTTTIEFQENKIG